jgi:hypothetical protein
VAFINPRGPGQYYIPFFGWLLYTATALVEGTKYLISKLPRSARFAPVRAVLLFLAVAAFMVRVNRPYTWSSLPAVALEGEQYRSIVQQVHQLHPSLRPGARVIFLNDPIDDPFQMIFLMRLSYGDDKLVIDRAKLMTPPPGATKIASYDYVLDFDRSRIYDGPHARDQNKGPEIALDQSARRGHHLHGERLGRNDTANASGPALSARPSGPGRLASRGARRRTKRPHLEQVWLAWDEKYLSRGFCDPEAS